MNSRIQVEGSWGRITLETSDQTKGNLPNGTPDWCRPAA
jgi:hypothetical protein